MGSMDLLFSGTKLLNRTCGITHLLLYKYIAPVLFPEFTFNFSLNEILFEKEFATEKMERGRNHVKKSDELIQ